MSDSYDQLHVDSRAEWRQWLRAHHRSSPGIWLVTWKTSSGKPTVPYGAIVEEALCFGWVDSLPRSLDADRSQLLVTPRKAGSNWSRLNKERVERLVASGAMTAAGRAVVDAAKEDGSWNALDDVENLIEPDDLATALDGSRAARRTWDGFPRSTKRGILEWILNAKKPETRAKRISQTVDEAAAGRRANQWRQPKGRG